MKINCGFVRRNPNKKATLFERKSVQNIEVNGLDWNTDHKKIRQELIKHKPDGDGWYLAGYALID